MITRQELTNARVRMNFEANHGHQGGWPKLRMMVESGDSLATIAAHFGISRQRAGQIIKSGGLR